MKREEIIKKCESADAWLRAIFGIMCFFALFPVVFTMIDLLFQRDMRVMWNVWTYLYTFLGVFGAICALITGTKLEHIRKHTEEELTNEES